MNQSNDLLLRTIGHAIRSRRRAHGLSQEALAALAQIDRSYMSSVERGLRNISVLNLARIAAALDVSVWELLGVDAAGGAPVSTHMLSRRDTLELKWKPGDYLSLG
ncbi:MAG TPA: helix-turn-helix transcriptional regulator [Vicinamibacterales bacterium]|nr:helix-turn-helix transcriptional regulator [Vicinamibacterales bacterium]